ncbi:unnamed protein product [Effrenium voratum]|nr:unnamed protein product [Effrenium voratum]
MHGAIVASVVAFLEQIFTEHASKLELTQQLNTFHVHGIPSRRWPERAVLGQRPVLLRAVQPRDAPLPAHPVSQEVAGFDCLGAQAGLFPSACDNSSRVAPRRLQLGILLGQLVGAQSARAEETKKDRRRDPGRDVARYEDNLQMNQLPSGLQFADVRLGTGESPKNGTKVTIDYVMMTTGARYGTKIDSTKDRDAPYTFLVGDESIIRGLTEAVLTMREGGIRRIVVPQSLGYTDESKQPVPPNFAEFQRFRNIYLNPNRVYQPDLVMDVKLFTFSKCLATLLSLACGELCKGAHVVMLNRQSPLTDGWGRELYPLLQKAASERGEARIVQHSSGARKFPNTDLEAKYLGKNGGDLGGNGNSMFFGGARWERYHQTKLANAVFTKELDTRLRAANSKVKACCAAPGLAATNLQVTTSQDDGFHAPWIMRFGQSGEDGTMPLLQCCAGSVESGDFFEPEGMGNIKGPPTKIAPEPLWTKPESGKILWEESEKACGAFKVE